VRRLRIAAVLLSICGCIYPTVHIACANPAGNGAMQDQAVGDGATIVAPWTQAECPADEVNLIAMGDWGANNTWQKEVARTLADYVGRDGTQFNAVLTCGDNMYVSLKDVYDKRWKTLFEDMYDATRLNMPFYATLGNHDYEGRKDRVELAYTIAHPDSRWRLPARWYRLDLPEHRPLVSILMLDSNRWRLRSEQWNSQLRWIDDELSRPRQAMWTICVAHHTIYSNGDHGDSSALQHDWGALFQKHKVDFYLCGHDHSLQHLRIKALSTSFVVCGGGGQTRKDMLRDDRGLFSRKLYGFAHLRLCADRAELSLIDGLNGQVVHWFTRTKTRRVGVLGNRPRISLGQ